MKLLLDAQMPRRLARTLAALGHDAIHTLDLPDGNRTSDLRICEIADADTRTVVTKDRDFVDSFLITGTPARLILVATGNIGNDELIRLFLPRLPELEAALRSGRFIEFSRQGVLLRD